MTSDNLRLGIVGASRYLHDCYLPLLASCSAVAICGVCDTGQPAFLRMRDYSNLPTFRSVSAMLRATDLDAVIISTPHVYHFEQAKECLEAGLHVYVDKPLACHYTEAATLVEMARRKGTKLVVGNQRRYEQAYDHVRQAVQEGRFGEIRLVNYLVANSPWHDHRLSWRGQPHQSGGGVLMDIGYLGIDVVTWVLDAPVKWVSAAASMPEGCRVEQSVALIVKFVPNTMASFTITYETAPEGVQEELSVFGTRGSVFTRRFQSKRSPTPPLVVEMGETYQEISYAEIPDKSRPLQDFLQCILYGCDARSSGASHLTTVQIIDRAYRSIALGCPVWVEAEHDGVHTCSALMNTDNVA